MIKELTYDGGSFIFNRFIPNAPFLYPLKTSENRKLFWCFQGVEKGTLQTNGLMGFTWNHLLKHSIRMTKCLKLSTWRKLNISIIVCFITSVLRGCYEIHLILFNFSLLLTLVTYFSKFFDIAFDIVPEKKELSNGGGSFTFSGFRPFTEIVYTDD